MANPEHVEILKKGAEAWNRWRKKNPLELIDLAHANLGGIELNDALLYNAELVGANLHRTRMRNTYLADANLSNANLCYSILESTFLRGAALTDADLRGSSIIEVDFAGADLSGDAPTGPRRPRSTVLTAGREAATVASRKRTLPAPDDCPYALRAGTPHLTRSGLHRRSQRHGISRLPEVGGEKPAEKKSAG